MGRPENDLTGQVFGKLTVIGKGEYRGRNLLARCRCECGVVKDIYPNSLKKGQDSCGCASSKRRSEVWKDPEFRKKLKRTTHGKSKTFEYESYCNMLNRCYNPDNPEYFRYGGKGITVCDRWRDPLTGIVAFIEDMGPRPKGMTIDRFPNPEGNYEPGNCRWATKTQQSRNIGKKKSNTSGYKGINELPTKRWSVEIRSNYSKAYLGCYRTKEEAAYAYDIASLELHGADGVRNGVEPPANAEEVRINVMAKIEKFRSKLPQSR